MKKVICILTLIVMTLSLGGCSGNAVTLATEDTTAASNITESAIPAITDKSDEACKLVKEYFTNIFAENYEAAYTLLAEKEKSVKPIEKFMPEKKTETTLADDLINDFRELSKIRSTILITGVKVQNEAYTVSYETSVPDLSQIITKLPKKGLLTDWEGARETLKEMDSDGTLPMRKDSSDVLVIEVNGELHLDFGWFDTNQEQIKALEGYKDLLFIHDVAIHEYTDSTYVIGYVNNAGDKDLTTVKVKIYYLDKEGNRVGEDETGSFTLNDSWVFIPIKENYESQFIVEVPDSVKDVWSKEVVTEITGLEFYGGSDEAKEVNEVLAPYQNNPEDSKDIEIKDFKIDTYSTSTYVSGTIKNIGHKTYETVVIRVYYLDKEGRKIGEDISTVYMENNSDAPISPNYQASFIFEVNDGLLKTWDKKVEIEVFGTKEYFD